ncbi:MAG: Transcriptional regulator, ArsR family, partial [uncultured Solirubrobacteraceae bacterium]
GPCSDHDRRVQRGGRVPTAADHRSARRRGAPGRRPGPRARARPAAGVQAPARAPGRGAGGGARARAAAAVPPERSRAEAHPRLGQGLRGALVGALRAAGRRPGGPQEGGRQWQRRV